GSDRSSGPGDVQILKRTKALSGAASASGIIGPTGGSLSIPRAGVEITFAPDAVTVPTRITVTAVEGVDVAYEFQPHGLQFAALASRSGSAAARSRTRRRRRRAARRRSGAGSTRGGGLPRRPPPGVRRGRGPRGGRVLRRCPARSGEAGSAPRSRRRGPRERP